MIHNDIRHDLIFAAANGRLDTVKAMLLANTGLLDRKIGIYENGNKVARPVWAHLLIKANGTDGDKLIDELFNYQFSIDNSIYDVLDKMNQDMAAQLAISPAFLYKIRALEASSQKQAQASKVEVSEKDLAEPQKDAYTSMLKARPKAPGGRRQAKHGHAISHNFNNKKLKVEAEPESAQADGYLSAIVNAASSLIKIRLW